MPIAVGKGVIVSGDLGEADLARRFSASPCAAARAVAALRGRAPRTSDGVFWDEEWVADAFDQHVSRTMYKKTTLPNGMRVLTETMPAVRSATVGIWADVGSAVEPRERRGISHLVEHMLFKGTPRRSAREIAETMDGVGGNLNAFTDKETTCYYAKVIDRHVPLAIDVLADMFLHSAFDPQELAKEQKVVLEEIKMYEDSPDELIHDLFLQTMWSGSNLGEPTIGFADTVVALTPDDLRAHMRAHYAPNSVVVAAAGNVEHDRFVELVAEQFAAFRGTCEPHRYPKRRSARRRATCATRTANRPTSCWERAASRPRRAALRALAARYVLGGGMSSRLFQEIREKRGLVYSVYSFQAAYRGAGLFGVYAGTSPENVQACIDLIAEQFDRVRAEPSAKTSCISPRSTSKGISRFRSSRRRAG